MGDDSRLVVTDYFLHEYDAGSSTLNGTTKCTSEITHYNAH